MSRPREDLDLLREALTLDPATGRLFWNTGYGGAYSGCEAFTAKRGDGYHVGMVRGVMWRRCRAVFAITYGFLPDCVDHINRVRDDDRPVNLRAATVQENNRNKTSVKGSRSRHLGVSFDKSRGKWKGQLYHNGKNHNTPRFNCETAAMLARATLAHKLHGDFHAT